MVLAVLIYARDSSVASDTPCLNSVRFVSIRVYRNSDRLQALFNQRRRNAVLIRLAQRITIYIVTAVIYQIPIGIRAEDSNS